MIYDRFYYTTLSSKGKQAYKIIYSGYERFEKSITISKNLICRAELMTVICAISHDNPHIYYVDFTVVNYVETPTNLIVSPTYWYSPSEVALLNTKMQTALNRMLKRITGNSEIEKEKSIHDLLVKNVIYDKTAADNLNKYFPRSNTVLGVLFYKSAVCEGISKTAKMLFNLLDIKCIVATGTATNANTSGPHAWNIVKIGGQPYHLDITWDIGLSSKWHISHQYFNLTDKQIRKDHSFKIVFPK